MAFVDPTYREQNGPDADAARRQSDLLAHYFNNPWITMLPAPTLFGTSVNPNLGSTGTAIGRYKRLGVMCWAQWIFTFAGTGVTTGTGDFYVNLPFAIPGTGDFRYMNGQWNVLHGVNGIVFNTRMYTSASTLKVGGVFSGAPAATASAGSTAPAAGDVHDITVCYEVGK